MRNIVGTILAVASVAVLAGCEQNTKPAQREAEKLEQQADRVEKQGDTVEKKFDERAEAIREKADAIANGVTYEVARVDKQAGVLHLTREDAADSGKNTTERDAKDADVALQSGRDLQVPLTELEALVAGDKKLAEIQEDLHEGENVTVFMDGNGKITKIDY